jgi:hypothetical protein
MVGEAYRNPSRMPDGGPFYGGYPRGYLERVHSMFPDAKKILHAFSGGLTHVMAVDVAWPDREWFGPSTRHTVELVDCMGPEEGRHPTWQGDVTTMPEEWAGRFDLVLADPPYSKEDAKKYGVKMPSMRQVLREIRRVTRVGGNLVWLDTRWVQHRKDEWKTWGVVGVCRSTNHRARFASFFRRV